MSRSALPPFESVLIANRGEIAVRIIRTARTLGMRTIAVCSEADRNAPHVRLAHEAHYIGPAPANESYLDIMRLIEVAGKARAASLHPGYGFLSERAELAEACAMAGVVFIGPSPRAIRALGDKAAAKELMGTVGVPVVPGYHGDRQEPAFLRQKAYEVGYPVAIKAAAGGGGKGMRRVEKAIDFDAALASAQREAQAAFGDQRVLIEKWIESPRHIEVQVFGDAHGNVVHLYERDCSAQRRHQKVIEESPAPGMTAEVRQAMTSAAVSAAQAAAYRGAGTVEFIADASDGLRADRFWFLEMNTRLQVEHPVTEAVTGLDLVEWQFRVAASEVLPLTQKGIPFSGHAVEARVYAEDPERNFLPSTGRLAVVRWPEGEGVRVDSGVEEGAEVSAFYDPMLAKIIVHAPTRGQALDRLALALDQTVVAGPRNNVGFLRSLVDERAMRDGRMDTGFIERNLSQLSSPQPPDFAAAAKAVETLVAREQAMLAKRAARRSNERRSPWAAIDAFNLAGVGAVERLVRIDGEAVRAQVRFGPGGPRVTIEGSAAADCLLAEAAGGLIAVRDGRQTLVALSDPDTPAIDQSAAGGIIVAPMHGKVLSIEVKTGERVRRGQRLAIIEAMKMEHALTAPADGEVTEVNASAGDQIAEGAKILVVAVDDASTAG